MEISNWGLKEINGKRDLIFLIVNGIIIKKEKVVNAKNKVMDKLNFRVTNKIIT